MTHDELILHAADGVLELRLNRAARLNALTHTLVLTLVAEVERALQDDSVRVLLLCAEGRSFCAGKDHDDPASDAFVEALQELAVRLVQGGKPAIAAVQGWAIGAGFELAINCDLVVASRDARFMLPEARLGLMGTGGVHSLLPRLIGLGRAKGLLWLGGELDATRAHEWGLVWEMADPADLQQSARRLAAELAALEPTALGRIKRLVHGEQIGDFSLALAREAAAHLPASTIG
jgi:enoyl-CoA hydratase/carnithine racemase